MEQHFNRNMSTMGRRIAFGFLFVPIAIGAFFLFSWGLMALWNAVLPAAIPAVNPIGYWQAMGIFLLSKILFGFGGGWGRKKRHWGNRMETKWNNMTPEERESFKSEWKNRCGQRWGGRYKEEPEIKTEQPDPGMSS